MPKLVLPRPGPHMLEALAADFRHKVLACGRRWRKSTLCLLSSVLGHGPRINGLPKYRGVLQGASIWWVTESFPIAESVWLAASGTLALAAKHVSEKHYRVTMPNGGTLTIRSAANPGSLKGSIKKIDGVVLDEAAFHAPEVWQRNIRPVLTDSKGWSIWASTPNGFNHFKQMFDLAKGGGEDWGCWQKPSSDNPFWDPSEVEASRRENMPETQIQTEYFAQFILSGAARTFHEFDETLHLAPQVIDLSLPLDLCISFGVAPPAFVVCQGGPGHGPERVLSEIHPPNGGTTVRAYLDEFRRMYPGRAGSSQVRVFGMVEGSASHSDYELVRAGLHPQVKHYIRSVAVDPKDRINAVNLALRDPDGEIGAQIDPLCESVVRDLQASRNAPSSFRMEKEAGLGHYAQAWSAKLLWVYPLVLETKRAHSSWSDSRPESTPEARLCQGRLNRAVRDGRVTKPKACEECRTVGYVEGAHFNYNPDEALRVRWLCRRCHLAWDLAEPKHGTKKR